MAGESEGDPAGWVDGGHAYMLSSEPSAIISSAAWAIAQLGRPGVPWVVAPVWSQGAERQ